MSFSVPKGIAIPGKDSIRTIGKNCPQDRIYISLIWAMAQHLYKVGYSSIIKPHNHKIKKK
jgi:hypothetical protein